MNALIAIDPGLSGALVLVGCQPLNVLRIVLMPTEVRTVGRGRQVDVHALASLMTKLVNSAPIGVRVLIEHQQATPQMGVSSSFSLGRSYGALLGIVAAIAGGYETVRPVAWKRALGLAGKPKEAAITYINQRHPRLDWVATTKEARLGVADALCIAHWGTHHWRQETTT
jgi:crossover junction endodeoxyribonuclease RuvC